MRLLGTLLLSTLSALSQAKSIESHVSSRAELEYGTVLFEFYQQDYFSALVENELMLSEDNPLAKAHRGQVTKGGMLLSYGVADKAEVLLRGLLSEEVVEPVRNRIWYFLARYYYNKSSLTNAAEALNRITGRIPPDLHFDYHYLATLLSSSGIHKPSEDPLAQFKGSTGRYAYLQFNLAITQLKQGQLVDAVSNLEQVAAYDGEQEEYLVLADRAKHGLSQLAIRAGRIDQAWLYLTQIRTTGLYSNRALLSYAWAAIKIERFTDAIAALKVLNTRSIALPEVQEAKVLLAHLYEQEGSPRKALKANLLSIKDFKQGVAMVNEARRIIEQKDVPREFITNMEAIMDDSDWHSAQPSVDYKSLTPFLIDLMSSNPFHETLKELADLYSLRRNLERWLDLADEHLLILDNAEQMKFDIESQTFVKQSRQFNDTFANQQAELSLLTLTLSEDEQERVSILLDSTANELAALDEKVTLLNAIQQPYDQPKAYRSNLLALHERVRALLTRTEKNVAKLEPVMRSLVNAELDKHEDRMNYYWAQSRLAKARLYDTTLSTLNEAQREIQQDTKQKGSK